MEQESLYSFHSTEPSYNESEEKVKRICPICSSVVKLVYINFNEKLLMCVNADCDFPFGYEELQIVSNESELRPINLGADLLNYNSLNSGTSSVVSTAAWSDLDKLNRICYSDDTVSVKNKRRKSRMEIKMNQEKIKKDLENIKKLTTEWNQLQSEEESSIKNEAWLKNLMTLQGMSGQQLLKREEINKLKKNEPTLGLCELKININSKQDDISVINVQFCNKNESTSEEIVINDNHKNSIDSNIEMIKTVAKANEIIITNNHNNKKQNKKELNNCNIEKRNETNDGKGIKIIESIIISKGKYVENEISQNIGTELHKDFNIKTMNNNIDKENTNDIRNSNATLETDSGNMRNCNETDSMLIENCNNIGSVIIENYNKTDSKNIQNCNETDSMIIGNCNNTGSVVIENYNKTDSLNIQNCNETDSMLIGNCNNTGNVIIENYDKTDSINIQNGNETESEISNCNKALETDTNIKNADLHEDVREEATFDNNQNLSNEVRRDGNEISNETDLIEDSNMVHINQDHSLNTENLNSNNTASPNNLLLNDNNFTVSNKMDVIENEIEPKSQFNVSCDNRNENKKSIDENQISLEDLQLDQINLSLDVNKLLDEDNPLLDEINVSIDDGMFKNDAKTSENGNLIEIIEHSKEVIDESKVQFEDKNLPNSNMEIDEGIKSNQYNVDVNPEINENQKETKSSDVIIENKTKINTPRKKTNLDKPLRNRKQSKIQDEVDVVNRRVTRSLMKKK